MDGPDEGEDGESRGRFRAVDSLLTNKTLVNECRGRRQVAEKARTMMYMYAPGKSSKHCSQADERRSQKQDSPTNTWIRPPPNRSPLGMDAQGDKEGRLVQAIQKSETGMSQHA